MTPLSTQNLKALGLRVHIDTSILRESEGETLGRQTRMRTGPDIQGNDTTFNPKPLGH